MLIAWLSIIYVVNASELDYLRYYGYLVQPKGGSSMMMVGAGEVERAVRGMQHSFGLRETGVLDEATRRAMALPRCGVTDTHANNTTHRRRRAAEQRPAEITYRVEDADLRHAAFRATKIWSDETGVRFRETMRDADIVISWQPLSHSRTAADRQFGPATLAHAFLPRVWQGRVDFQDGDGISGDVHLNQEIQFDELIAFSQSGKVSLEAVLVHELGHSLGLSHNNDANSIMYPADQWRSARVTEREKRKVAEVWGVSMTVRPQPAPTRPPTTVVSTLSTTQQDEDEHRDHIRVDECATTPDCVAALPDGYIAFKGEWMWSVSVDGRVVSPARRVRDVTAGHLSTVDAALAVNHTLWLFQARRAFVCVRTGDRLRVLHAPITLQQLGLPGNTESVRLAYSWHFFTDATYFLWIGEQYWRFDPRQRKVERLGYPRAVASNWRHAPADAVGAFNYQGEPMFLTRDSVWKLDNNKVDLKLAEGYPRKWSSLWRGCEGAVSSRQISSSRPSSIFPALLLSYLLYF